MQATIAAPVSQMGSASRVLPAGTHISFAEFRVADTERALRLYSGLLGLRVSGTAGNTTYLSPSDSNEPMLLLTEDASAKPRPARAPGLFHLALLFPSRKALAGAFSRLYENRWPFQGFADHGVSEALYLADPEGNGIELYVDRPRSQWPMANGQVQMVTEQLDLDGLMSELGRSKTASRPDSTSLVIGHIHLQVSDLHTAEQFYHGMLGFDVTQRDFPGALFMSAGGYHHHIGVNIWNSRGAAAPPPGTSGLLQFGVSVGQTDVVQSLADKTRSSAHWSGETAAGFTLRDPNAITVALS